MDSDFFIHPATVVDWNTVETPGGPAWKVDFYDGGTTTILTANETTMQHLILLAQRRLNALLHIDNAMRGESS